LLDAKQAPVKIQIIHAKPAKLSCSQPGFGRKPVERTIRLFRARKNFLNLFEREKEAFRTSG
jgi:hypothetical protein